jgi:AcrR family transcriptional regulator
MSPERLPRGRHGLSREEVERTQRARLLEAMADAVMVEGYVATSVADVLRRAGVSRETFYQQFSSKLDCFMSLFEEAASALIDWVDAVAAEAAAEPGATGDDRLARFERGFGAYLDAMVGKPAYARVMLVEVIAAGPEALRHRAAVQARVVDRMASMLGVADDDATGLFACEALVAAIGALVTVPLVEGDVAGVERLREPVVALVRRALAVTPGPTGA